jgi:hypothetical protein
MLCETLQFTTGDNGIAGGKNLDVIYITTGLFGKYHERVRSDLASSGAPGTGFVSRLG